MALPGDPGNSGQDVTFPPRNEPFDFRQNVLEPKYRDQLRRPLQSTFVNIEGTIVWTQEYLRYRVNGCGHLEAVNRVFSQIEGRGIAPVCSLLTGTPIFPPRNEPLDFRQRLEVKYRDEIRAAPSLTAVDIEGDIVWTQEYLRYRLTGCSNAEASDKVISQIDNRGIAPDCSTPPPNPNPTPNPNPNPTPTPTCSYALIPGGNSVAQSGGTFSLNVSVQAGCSWQLSSNSPWLRPSATSGSGSATVSYVVDANGGQGRTGRVSLTGSGGATAAHDVSQAGTTVPSCTYNVAPTTINIIANGGSVTTTVTTQAGCLWTASSNSGFVTINSGASGSATGVVSLQVTANSGSAARTGSVRVNWSGGGQDVVVSQAAPPVAVAPVANFTVSSIPCPLTGLPAIPGDTTNSITNCRFDGSSSTADEPIVKYEWVIVNTNATGQVVNGASFQCFTFSSGETEKPVTLTITTASGRTATTGPRQVRFRKDSGC